MFPSQFIIRFLTWMPFPSSNIDFFEYMMKRLLIPLYCTLSSLGNCLGNVNSQPDRYYQSSTCCTTISLYFLGDWSCCWAINYFESNSLWRILDKSHLFFRNMMTSFCWVFTPRCCSSCDFFVPIHPWRDMSQPSLRPLANCGLHPVFFSWPKTAL